MTVARPGVVAVIGAAEGVTAALRADLERLGYRPEALTWPAQEFVWHGGAPVATLADLQVLGFEARRACQAIHAHPTLKNSPLVAIVSEAEASRLDLSLGFDDLLLAPYRLSELAARLRLLAWRHESQLAPGLLRVGRLTLDEATYEVRIDGAPVDLTLKEYQLLLFLVRNPNRVFTREELLDRVRGDEYYGGTRTVDVHVRPRPRQNRSCRRNDRNRPGRRLPLGRNRRRLIRGLLPNCPITSG